MRKSPRNTNYRKIYINHYGPIPVDENGRKYDIHHIDGDHRNNVPSNLQALSIEEHYKIHRNKNDIGACLMMKNRMKLSPEEISELCSLRELEKMKRGTHHFLDREFQKRNGEKIREARLREMEKGILVVQQPEVKANCREATLKLFDEGNHPFQSTENRSLLNDRNNSERNPWRGSKNNKRLIENGKHPSQKEWICEHCGKTGKGSTNYKRWHGDKCKEVKNG